MAKKIKLGVVGCGWIASIAHLPCYRMMPNARVIAVMDTIKERARLTARAFHVKKWYYDYEEMLKDDEIEAVDICTPPNAHAEQAIKAAKSGKHILCEKPISTNEEDALKLELEVKKAGVKFMTGFTYRFHPLLRKARKEVTNPKFLRISYSFRPSVASDHWIHNFGRSGGFIIEQAVHWFDLLRWCCGRARSVYAKGQANYPFQNMAALISYEKGALGLINYNSNSPLAFFLLTIENSEKSAMVKMGLLPTKWGGILEIKDRCGRPYSYFLKGGGIHKTQSRVFSPLSNIMSKIQDSHLVPFYKELEHFVYSVLSDCHPEVSLQDGLESLKLAIATQRSIDQGKEIHIEY